MADKKSSSQIVIRNYVPIPPEAGQVVLKIALAIRNRLPNVDENYVPIPPEAGQVVVKKALTAFEMFVFNRLRLKLI